MPLAAALAQNPEHRQSSVFTPTQQIVLRIVETILTAIGINVTEPRSGLISGIAPTLIQTRRGPVDSADSLTTCLDDHSWCRLK